MRSFKPHILFKKQKLLQTSPTTRETYIRISQREFKQILKSHSKSFQLLTLHVIVQCLLGNSALFNTELSEAYVAVKHTKFIQKATSRITSVDLLPNQSKMLSVCQWKVRDCFIEKRWFIDQKNRINKQVQKSK